METTLLTKHSARMYQRAIIKTTLDKMLLLKTTQLRGHQLEAISYVASMQFFNQVWLQTSVLLVWCVQAQEGCASVCEGRMRMFLEETKAGVFTCMIKEEPS